MSPTAGPRPGLRDVAPYVSPQLDVDVRLNTNESPHPLPRAVTDDITAAVREVPLNRYPDAEMRRLREDLAGYHGHPVEGVWAANGSNEILSELLQGYGGPGRRAAIFLPTYPLHERLSWLTHTEIEAIVLDPPYALTPGDAARALAADPDVIFVCSPNNPVGSAQPVAVVAELAAGTRGLVVVDEAYIEFGGESTLKLTADHPNLAVVRTFSKAFALAGVRLGYVLTSPEVVGDLRRVRLPYHLSSLAQAAGIAALRHTSEALEMVDAITVQRDRLADALASIGGMTVFPSDANFVSFVPPAPAVEVWRGLLDRGVLVRDLSSIVPNALRVTAGDGREVDRFLACLREVLAA